MKKIFFLLILLMLPPNLVAVEFTDNSIVFEYKDQNAESVFIVGSMNDWNTSSLPMQRDEDGTWKIQLKLEYGEYRYKFMVDGNWQVDPSNSRMEDDGYGGSNSVVYFSGRSSLKKNFEESLGVKSSLNPKVLFKGYYFSKNIFIKNKGERFMLDKPEHDINFGINIKFNSEFEGYSILNINNNKENTEMWRTHLNYKRSYLKLNTDYVKITAFDNIGIVKFDNPLHIVGDIGYKKYNFGYNYSGVYMETKNLVYNFNSNMIPFSAYGQILLSDKSGYDEDDINAMRMKITQLMNKNNKIILGTSEYNYTTKVSENNVQNHKTNEIDFQYLMSFSSSNWKNDLRLKVLGEYSRFTNSNIWPSKVLWMEGGSSFLGLDVKFPSALEIKVNYLISSFELTNEYSRNRFELDASYYLNQFNLNIAGQYWINDIDSDLGWLDYYKYIEKTDFSGRWYQDFSEVSFEKYTILGYEKGFLWRSDIGYKFKLNNKSIELNLKNKVAQPDLFVYPKYVESIFIVSYDLFNKWILKFDTRVPYYNDPFLGIKTDLNGSKNIFISTYTELLYKLSPKIWISFGYGVNPISMDSVSDEFHGRGREEFLNAAGSLTSHLESFYTGLGDKIIEAETLLMEAKQISIQGIINF